MIPRMAKIQVTIFAVISIVGITYVGANYVGIDEKLHNRPYIVQVDLADTGGLFTNAEVTYRGVTIGRVGRIDLTPHGVTADLKIERNRKVPADTVAVVANRSAVGEQYIDLQPRRHGPPFLRTGSRIAQTDTGLPPTADSIMVNLDRLVDSVDRRDLQTVVAELGTAFAGSGDDLQTLVDSGLAFTESAAEALPETISLINSGAKVLKTQADQGTAITAFARDLRLLSNQFRASDPDIRRILDVASPAAAELTDLIKRLDPVLPSLLANMISTGQIVDSRLRGIEQMLVTFPLAMTELEIRLGQHPGWAPLGMVTSSDPPTCTKGYEGTVRRDPLDIRDIPVNVHARCAEPGGSPTNVRGSANAPRK